MSCLADPLGYVVQFEPYDGAGQGLFAFGLGGSVVMDLMSELLSVIASISCDL